MFMNWCFEFIYDFVCFLYTYMYLASAHLLSERDRVGEQIKLLIEERDLIDKHLIDQQSKQREVCNLTIPISIYFLLQLLLLLVDLSVGTVAMVDAFWA